MGDAPRGESAAQPEANPSEPEEGPIEPGASLADSKAVNPIEAALKSGHFDEEAFLKSASAPEDPAQEDADPAGEDADAPVGGVGVRPEGGGEPSGA